MQSQRFTEQKEQEQVAAVTHDVGGAINFNQLQSDKNLIGYQQPIVAQQQSSLSVDKNKQIFAAAQSLVRAEQGLVQQVLLDKNNLVQLEPELKQEIVSHPPLHHTTIVHDASKPILTTETDKVSKVSSSSSAASQQQQSSVAAQILGMRDQAVARASQIAANVSVAASNLKDAAASKIEEMKQDNSTPSNLHHYMQPEMKEEIAHASLHHNTIVSDHSAPVLSVPSDHNVAPTPSVTAQLGDLKDIAVAKAAPIAASISAAAATAAASVSAAASNLKQAASDKIIEMKKEQEAAKAAANAPHYIQTDLKQEIQHPPSLHHNTLVNDHSAPVVAVPSDHNIAPQPTMAQQLSDLKDIAVAKSAPIAASISAAASSAAATVSASVSAAASNLKQAASDKITEMKKDQVLQSTPHYIQPALKEELSHHAPLHHVTDVSKDHSAPMLSAPTDSISSGPMPEKQTVASSMLASLQHAGEVISHTAEDLAHKAVDAFHSVSSPSQKTSGSSSPLRHDVRHPTPMHPDIVLHPGPIDLSGVHSTLPKQKDDNLLANQHFDAKQVEVHNGGIAWALPLEQQAVASSSSSLSSAPLAAVPQTVSSISTTPNSVTYSTLSTTPSSITYTTTTKTVETIPAADLNRSL